MVKIRFRDLDELTKGKQVLLYANESTIWQKPLIFNAYEVDVTNIMCDILDKNSVKYEIVEKETI